MIVTDQIAFALFVMMIIPVALIDFQVVVYAKTWCPHCKATKELLAGKYGEVKTLIRDLDIMDDPSGPCLAKALTNYSGQTSVPNIFINGEHFGGNSDLQEAHTNGTLKL